MYSNKENVNTLTALLVAHGVKHAVVCPGSRNAPIVHNLNECPHIACYPVTDERSAGFFALGIAQTTDQPVVVCVTSGTALLNVAPAVAEACYQHQSLIVISADRPAEWIDQLDGQTLRQPGAIDARVKCSVSLPEDKGWYCNRLVNEALIEATSDQHPCVHINVPISEPLFQFSVAELPSQRIIQRFTPAADYDCLPQPLIDDFIAASRPLIIFGQLSPRRFHYEGLDNLFSHVLVLHEALSPLTSVSHFESVLADLSAQPSTLSPMLPDFILYVGDAIVSKRLKHFLRQAADARCWRISLTGQVEDTFQNLSGIIVGDAEFVLQSLNNKLFKHTNTPSASRAAYRRQWLHLLQQAKDQMLQATLPYSEAAAVALFEQQLEKADQPFEVHYANSTAVRLANIYAQHPVFCNRGVNGIEGSLSTAAGMAAATSSKVCCVIGDLSFFYDQNALWNQNLGGNLRILLLNNGQGGIFRQLRGLEKSDARERFVAGAHNTSAEGICRQCDVGYRHVATEDELVSAIEWLLASGGERPRLVEVTTDAETDAQMLHEYYMQLSL